MRAGRFKVSESNLSEIHRLLMTRRFAVCAISLCVALLVATQAAAQTAQNVLIVINEQSPESKEIGEYYLQKRQIPPANVVRLQLPLTDDIDRATYQSKLEGPLIVWFNNHAAWDRILYIVVTKGVPLRVSGTTGQGGTIASVDSELTLLYRKMAGAPIVVNAAVRNPYYVEDVPQGGFTRFSHEKYDIFLVTRLDAFTVAQAKALVDRGTAPSRDGEIVLDGRIEVGQTTPGNSWLERAAAALGRINGWKDRVTLDTGGKRAGRGENLLGYYSWGSNDVVIQTAGAPELKFNPGALAAMFVSTDARTFRQPPDGWQPGTKTPFAGSNQSLTGELIRQGATGAAGHVAEPFLAAAIRPDVLFPAYVSGMNLAESFYSAMPLLSWQTVVIGDPLVAPFRQKNLEPAQIEAAVDPVSELPGFFTQHRLKAPTRGEIKEDAWKLFMRADYLAIKGETRRSVDALEKAAAADDRLVAAHVLLAAIAQTGSNWDEAIARFRRALAYAPQNVTVLNDLAYLLAEHKNLAKEALPLAAKAYQISKGQPMIGDTLAWTQHLLGQDAEAAPIIRQAAKQLPRVADVQLHAAIILGAIGDMPASAAALEAAVKLNPKFEERADVRALRAKLKK
jgi:uncharacterized protein (TIGR03790 family)